MKKIILLLPLLGVSIALCDMKIAVIPPAYRIDYPQETALKDAEAATVAGTLIGIVGSVVMFGAGYYHFIEGRTLRTRQLGLASCVFFPAPTIVGIVAGKAIAHYAPIMWLAKKYNCSSSLVTTAIKYDLSLADDKELLVAANEQGIKSVAKILAKNSENVLGSDWKAISIKMMDDFQRVMNNELSDKTDRQKLKELRDIGYLENYNPVCRQYFSLLFRQLLAVYELYHKSTIKFTAKHKHGVYVDDRLDMTPEFFSLVRAAFNQFVVGEAQ